MINLAPNKEPKWDCCLWCRFSFRHAPSHWRLIFSNLSPRLALRRWLPWLCSQWRAISFLQSFYNLSWERRKKKLQDCVQGIRCLSYRDCYLSNKTRKSSKCQSMTTKTCTKHSHGRTEAQTQIFVSWRQIDIDTWGGKPGLGPGLPCCGGCPGCPGGWPGWCPGSPGYRCCPG